MSPARGWLPTRRSRCLGRRGTGCRPRIRGQCRTARHPYGMRTGGWPRWSECRSRRKPTCRLLAGDIWPGMERPAIPCLSRTGPQAESVATLSRSSSLSAAGPKPKLAGSGQSRILQRLRPKRRRCRQLWGLCLPCEERCPSAVEEDGAAGSSCSAPFLSILSILWQPAGTEPIPELIKGLHI